MENRMQELVAAFGSQLAEAIAIGKTVHVKPFSGPVSSVNILGLGGSAFGGELTRNWAWKTGKAPVMIHRGYDAPAYLNETSLVIASSYSGNTEETLSSAEQARLSGARVIVITSGGKLKIWAEQHGLDCIIIPGGQPPRSACGYSFVQQLYILRQLGLIPDFEAELNEALGVINGFGDHEAAKDLAKALDNTVPVIYVSDAIDSIGIRLRQQINENSKQLCWHHVLPEMNHNELVGWEFPETFIHNTVIVFIRSSYEHKRVAVRFDINRTILEPRVHKIVELQPKGKSLLAQMLYLLHLADWISIYMADNNEVEAAPVKIIDFLKGELDRIQ